MEKNTVVQLRRIAKESGLHGYSKLRKAELIRLIQSRATTSSSTAAASSTTATAVGVSKRAGGGQPSSSSPPDDSIPQRENPKREKRERVTVDWSGIGEEEGKKWLNEQTEKKIEKAVDWGKKKVEDWGQWLKETANTSSKPRATSFVDDKLKDFKEYINELYKKSDQRRFKLVEKMSSLKQFAKMYTIDGGLIGFGPRDFLEAVRPTVINFLNTQKDIKIEFIFRCEMIKKTATGEVQTITAYFSSFQKIVFQETDREELYQECVEKMMESLAEFKRRGSGWNFYRVMGLDLHTVKYTPLKGSSYIELPKHLAKRWLS